MAVQDETSFKRYAANGVATTYAIPFLLLAAADLLVTLDGNPVVSGFTVTGLGANTGQIIFAAAPTGDLLLQRVVPFERLTDYQDNGDLLAHTVNRDFDRLWLAVQELRRDDGRALVVSPLEPEGIPPLPVAALRQLRVLGFDAVGAPVPSNLTMAELEQQPALAQAAAQAAAASALQAAGSADESASSAGASEQSATVASDAETKARQWAENPEDDPVEPGQFSALHWAKKAAAAAGTWAQQPIGVPIPVWDHMPGLLLPQSDAPSYRYIKLTASDSYNAGALTGETVSGSAPLVVATAVISDPESPINGQTISLINTERRFLRAGGSGSVAADTVQGHYHSVTNAAGLTIARPTGGATGGASDTGAAAPAQGAAASMVARGLIADGSNGDPRVSTETRPKNIGTTYYMRIR